MVGSVPRSSAPVIAENTSLGDILLGLAAVVEAVGEYLVHHAALEEIGSFILLVVYGKLEEVALLLGALVAVDTLYVAANAAAGVRKVIIVYSAVACVVFA